MSEKKQTTKKAAKKIAKTAEKTPAEKAEEKAGEVASAGHALVGASAACAAAFPHPASQKPQTNT